MRTAALAWTLSAMLALLHAAPAPDPEPAPAPAPAPAAAPADDSTPEVIEIIAPAASAQETLATLNLGAVGGGAELSERNKRTIGILRQLFPALAQTIQQKIQQFTNELVRAFGPVLLRAALGGGASGTRAGGGGGGSGTIDLEDDDDDDDDGDDNKGSTTSTPSARVRRALSGASADAGETGAASGDEQQLLSGAESQQAEVRVAFGEDQQAAAQTNNAAIDEITLDDGDASEENRNKRFLNFGVGAEASAGGGGSGNFIFDIVRRPAEAMARAAGSAFRLFAGTDSLNVGLTASHTATRDAADAQLVAGSSSGGAGVGADAGVDGVDDATAAKGDGLTEGVPGPITRLFIIANRGIANLIQDLILRLAQTSERIVNFKARLITSII